MSMHTRKHISLMPADKNIIVHGNLTDIHIEHFHYLLRNCSECTPVEMANTMCQ